MQFPNRLLALMNCSSYDHFEFLILIKILNLVLHLYYLRGNVAKFQVCIIRNGKVIAFANFPAIFKPSSWISYFVNNIKCHIILAIYNLVMLQNLMTILTNTKLIAFTCFPVIFKLPSWIFNLIKILNGILFRTYVDYVTKFEACVSKCNIYINYSCHFLVAVLNWGPIAHKR